MLVGLIVVVVGLRVFTETKTFFVRFEESVTGLEESSTVRLNGVPIGRVADIGFVENSYSTIEVMIEVEPDAPITDQTMAELKPQGITGINYIDLFVPKEKKGAPFQRLAAGSTIQSVASVTVQLMETLAGLGAVVKKVDVLLSSNEDDISEAIEEIKKGAIAARVALESLERQMGALTARLEEELSTTVASARQRSTRSATSCKRRRCRRSRRKWGWC